MQIKKWIVTALALTMFVPILATKGVLAADEDNQYYNEYEHTYVNLALATINASDYDQMTESQLREMLQQLAAAMGPSGFNAFFEDFLHEYNIPETVNVRNVGKLKWNPETFWEKYQIVYGTPADVKKIQDNDVKVISGKQEHRFLGFDTSANPFINMDFPPDASKTDNVGTRNWLPEPWNHRDEVHNNLLPADTIYMNNRAYFRAERIQWLDSILDKYTGKGTTRGNFNPLWTGEKLINYAVIQQMPTITSPGQVTMWHRHYDGEGATSGYDYLTKTTRNYKDWYDTFALAPTGDITEMLLEYWDNLKVTARWHQEKVNGQWGSGTAQKAGTPTVIYANVQGLLPRFLVKQKKALAERYADENHKLNVTEINGEQIVRAKVYFVLASTKEIIGAVPVNLENGSGPKSVFMNWKFPKQNDSVHVVVVPDYEQNPNFREYFLQDNVMTLNFKVENGTYTEDDTINLNGDGLDNIKINALVPTPGNGGRKPGERIDYTAILQADLPTKYVMLSFNGEAQSNPIPLYAEVAESLNHLDALAHVTVSSSGQVTTARTFENWEYISKTCRGIAIIEGGRVTGYKPDFECGSYGYITRPNPNYDTAKSAVASLKNKWNEINATVTLQGKTCTVTIVRGGDEVACTVQGNMPETESDVVAKVNGAGITETTYKDNVRAYKMYPILPQKEVKSVVLYTKAYNREPKTGELTENTINNPAKYGQKVSIKAASTAGVEKSDIQFGYQTMRMYAEFATVDYKDNIPLKSSLKSSGKTPSAIHNGVSDYQGNQTWDNDFRTTKVDGENMIYLHKVTKESYSYKGYRWDHYDTFYANGNSSVAKVAVQWDTNYSGNKGLNDWLVDLVATPKDPIGWHPQYNTIPPLKNGVPAAISSGGSYQTVNFDINAGTKPMQIKVYLFGTLTRIINTGT
ncbi:Athe_2463 domain-containing protein [Cohnella abietis]|uniref:Uncharacterized protein n=1 Tax=Cohnella abietis TaxID=2507935 RepID=A0A3T1CY71_9BACL|nr:hypothetical protein [Cohnella abietis]BBI30751.1 hypothetical protein KCTCHS21_01500 [Cohnella abietis]